MISLILKKVEKCCFSGKTRDRLTTLTTFLKILKFKNFPQMVYSTKKMIKEEVTLHQGFRLQLRSNSL